MSDKIIAYYRVSTSRQGISGLGLESQKQAVKDYARLVGASLASEYTEVESGKLNDRPILKQAINESKLTGRPLVIAKLDRLSRNAAFLLSLKDSGVNFVCCDLPDMNPLTVGILAVVAQAEREMISLRTKAALAQAKARGVKLGNPNGVKNLTKGNVYAVKRIQINADNYAKSLKNTIKEIKSCGVKSYKGIASELNKRGVKTPRNTQFYAQTVKNILQRLEDIPE